MRKLTPRLLLVAKPAHLLQAHDHLLVAKVGIVLELGYLAVGHRSRVAQDPRRHAPDLEPTSQLLTLANPSPNPNPTPNDENILLLFFFLSIFRQRRLA